MPNVGDFAVTRTGGWAARAIRWITRSPINHAFVYVGDGMIVEGQPRGAALNPVTEWPDAIWANWPLTAEQAQAIVGFAHAHVGVGYSYLDCGEIGWVDLRMRLPRWLRWLFPVPWFLRNDLATTQHMMCSALVDAAYRAGGVQLFADGRPFGAVAPCDLYQLIQKGRT